MIHMKVSGLEETIQHVDRVHRSLISKQKQMLEKLAAIGVETASIKFISAQYDGFNDVKVSEPEWIDENKLQIVASGQAVGFIEFGTGVHYAERHPKADEFGAIRGGYGQHKGLKNSWGYYGDPGTNGKEVAKKNGQVVVITNGNPPARAMYDAGKEMRSRILEIAKEVYGDD
jgi:hypothetical protein